MIFLTVGTQLGFDRLVLAIDKICKECPDVLVFGQIGPGKYTPKYFKYKRSLSLAEYSNYFDEANIVISHAGMGTIINCLVNNKPLILVPRLAEYNEHRNDHQLATIKKFSNVSMFFIPSDLEGDLKQYLTSHKFNYELNDVSPYAPVEMLDKLQDILTND